VINPIEKNLYLFLNKKKDKFVKKKIVILIVSPRKIINLKKKRKEFRI
jgi:hypothetical protein